MSDSTSGALNPVEQGTVFMLSLGFGLLAIAVVYFACIWYRKRKRVKPTQAPLAGSSHAKPSVARSFSRFSQVDEELTFYGDEIDIDLPDSLGLPPTSTSPKRNRHHIKRSRAATQTATTAPPPQKSKQWRQSAPPGDRQYLETSM